MKMEEKYSLNNAQQLLLKWIQVILLFVCGIVLIFVLITDSTRSEPFRSYFPLIQVVLILLGISHYFFRQKKFTISSRLLVLTGVIGPWGSAIFDLSVSQGNLFPLVYLTIPIILSGLFTPITDTIVVGAIQLIGLTVFNFTNQIAFSGDVSSLYFYIIFIYAISLILNYLNRLNQKIIDQQIIELEKLAMIDQLTGLYNRHFLNEFLKKEFAKLDRTSGDLAIVIMDIDDFKEFNDSLGHDCGDSLLKGLAELLKISFRSSDVICRFGGDEFLIAMSSCNISKAEQRCRDFAASITAKNMECTIKLNKPMTLSIGIAANSPNHHSELDLIKAADNALYRAKDKGKNRIELA